MAATSTKRDPRTIITPEAFRVSPDLLGLQLASPGRRLVAILIDLVFIGILTLVTRNFVLMLAVVAAVALVRSSVRRLGLPGTFLGRAKQAALGCLGLSVAGTALLVWALTAFDNVRDELFRAEFNDDSTEVRITAAGRQLTLRSTDEPTDSTEPIELRDARAVRQGVSLYTLEEAIDRYVQLRGENSSDPMDRELVRALEERLAGELASDTLRALDDRIAELERESRRTRQELQDAEEQLDRAVSGGIVSWFRGLLDDVGFGFGWAALYMTVLLSMTNGQTLGKRLLGIRVLRLDGQRLSWWMAFERSGGYAAGFATGLLGFAQIFWDANRQAIHDRIMGTVVVREGAPRIEDWESAL